MRARLLFLLLLVVAAPAVARPAPDFEQALHEAKRGFEGDIIRDAWAWRPQLKTRDPARLRLAAARYLFARYALPAHLEAVWLDTDGLGDDEISLRKRWYVTVAGGGSLYKAGADEWLSRKEVHWFLNPPGELGFDVLHGIPARSAPSSRQSCWWGAYSAVCSAMILPFASSPASRSATHASSSPAMTWHGTQSRADILSSR